jgi:hypothetical protein
VDNFKLLNFVNFNDIGSNPLNESAAFKKIRMFSKTFTANLVTIPNNFSDKYHKFSAFINNDLLFFDSLTYGFKRQHNYLNNSAITNNNSTFFDLNSSAK